MLIVAPLLACTVLLLLVASSHNYGVNTPASRDLLLGDDSVMSSDYLIIHNATASSLLTISSWTSNIAVLLPNIVMALSSCHVAGSLIKASESGDMKNLPTPYQLALLLNSLTKRFYSLWCEFLYKWWKRREKGVPALRWNCYLLLCTLLSYSIGIADTAIYQNTSIDLPPHFQNIDAQCKAFGFGKPEGCDSFYDRTLNGTASPHRATQGNIPNPTKIVANLSSAYQIMNTTQRSYPVDKYSVTRFSFLVPKHSDRTIDYITSTIAINGTCKPISQKCNLRPENSTALFNCSGAFSGQLGQDSVAFTGCTPNIRGCTGLFIMKH